MDSSERSPSVTFGVQSPQSRARPRGNPPKLPPYNVVVLDDNDHTYEYVMRMLGVLFAFNSPKSYKLAKHLDTTGRVILLTTTKEHAELKRDQIHAFGPDKLIASCVGAMSAIIEPAEDQAD